MAAQRRSGLALQLATLAEDPAAADDHGPSVGRGMVADEKSGEPHETFAIVAAGISHVAEPTPPGYLMLPA